MSLVILVVGVVLVVLGAMITEGASDNFDFRLGFFIFLMGSLSIIAVLISFMRVSHGN